MKNKILVFGLVSLLSIGTIIGVLTINQGVSFADKNNTKVEQRKESENDDEEMNLKNVKVDITEDAAKQIAMDSITDGTLVSIELEDEDGVIVYGVEINFGDLTHDVKVDANTGTILKDDTDIDANEENEEKEEKELEESDAKKDENDINTDVKLTENKAIQIAKNSVDGKSKVLEVELENENGIIVYGIELTVDDKEIDVKVDANSGQIVSHDDDDQFEHENGNEDSEKDED